MNIIKPVVGIKRWTPLLLLPLLVDIQPIPFISDDIKKERLFVGARKGKDFPPLLRHSTYSQSSGSPIIKALMKRESRSEISISLSRIMKSNISNEPFSCCHVVPLLVCILVRKVGSENWRFTMQLREKLHQTRGSKAHGQGHGTVQLFQRIRYHVHQFPIQVDFVANALLEYARGAPRLKVPIL